jgi:hypothetical protein
VLQQVHLPIKRPRALRHLLGAELRRHRQPRRPERLRQEHGPGLCRRRVRRVQENQGHHRRARAPGPPEGEPSASIGGAVSQVEDAARGS